MQDIACYADSDCPRLYSCQPHGRASAMATYLLQQAKYAVRHPLQALRFGVHPTLFAPSSSRSICVAAQGAAAQQQQRASQRAEA